MCRLSSAQYDHYRRTNAGLGASLFGWLRDLWRPHRPRTDEAEVVPFPAAASVQVEQEADRGRSEAA